MPEDEEIEFETNRKSVRKLQLKLESIPKGPKITTFFGKTEISGAW